MYVEQHLFLTDVFDRHNITDNQLFRFQMRDHRSRLSRLSHRCFEHRRPTLFRQTDVHD